MTASPSLSGDPVDLSAPDGDVVWCVRLGLVPYEEALDLQRRLEAARRERAVPDLLLLLEHPPVYTLGRRARLEELPMGEAWYRAQGIDVRASDRGGQVTYHGPGQLVGYPIVSLHPYRDDVRDYVRRMEAVIVGALAACAIEAGPVRDLTGVWTAEQRKIASIGVHVSRGITRHGFAINVNNDLQPFEWIVPCGIEHCRMSSIARERRESVDMERFMDAVCEQYGRVYERRPVGVELGALQARLERDQVAA